MTRDKGFMDLTLFKQAIDQCEGKVKFSYLHQMGEPLLYPYLVEAINYAEDHGIKTSISTNCHFLSPERSKNLIDSRLSELILCVDSFDPEKYSQIRRKGNLTIVRQNIEQFLLLHTKSKSCMNVVLQMIRMSANKSEGSELFKFDGEYEIWLKPFSTFAGAVDDEEKEPPRRFTCSKPFTHMTIQWNGDVVPCCRDFNGVIVMGNINDNSISEIWNSEIYNDFRINFKDSEFCREC
jgi:MoaA/NifB/PqqE/SkfB family radical SAM enzyme